MLGSAAMNLNPNSAEAPVRLAYLVSQYPMLSMIFIIREVLQLRQLVWRSCIHSATCKLQTLHRSRARVECFDWMALNLCKKAFLHLPIFLHGVGRKFHFNRTDDRLCNVEPVFRFQTQAEAL